MTLKKTFYLHENLIFYTVFIVSIAIIMLLGCEIKEIQSFVAFVSGFTYTKTTYQY